MSEEGRRSESTTSPVASETGTMCSGFSSSYGTPLGLMAMRPAARSTPDTFPNVPITRPLRASAMFAR